MQARIIETKAKERVLLCSDGSIAELTRPVLTQLFTKFKTVNNLYGKSGRWDQESSDMSVYPGKTLAYVTDDYQLLVKDGDVFASLMAENSDRYVEYLSTIDYAKKHDRSHELIKVFCREGKIMGAKKVGNTWLVPADAPYPINPANRKK